MAINPVALQKLPGLHANLQDTDMVRLGDTVLRLCNQPTELIRFTGDGVLTSKDVQTNLTRVAGGMVFNMTDGTDWSAVVVKPHATDPTIAALTSIPADTDVYLLVVWGDDIVSET